MTNPNACRWCGIDQRSHGRQYTNTAGWHTWGQLAASKIRARLLARRKRTTATCPPPALPPTNDRGECHPHSTPP